MKRNLENRSEKFVSLRKKMRLSSSKNRMSNDTLLETDTLDNIGEDMIIEVSSYLELEDCLNLGLVSSNLYYIVDHHYFWMNRYFLDYGRCRKEGISFKENYKEVFTSLKGNHRKLEFAISNNLHRLMKRLLLEKVRYLDFDIFRCLNLVIETKNFKTYRTFTKYGLKNDRYYDYQIERAIECDNLTVLKYLHSCGCSRDNQIKGMTQLYVASMNNSFNILKHLINEGIDINAPNQDGCTSLYIACQEGHYDIVNFLLSRPELNKEAELNGFTPLYISCKNGHIIIVKLLIEHGSRINVIGGDGSTPLYIATQNGHSEVVKTLLENGADPSIPFMGGYTPLYIACQYGNFDSVNYLINAGSDVNLVSPNGSTPLYVASQNGHVEVVKKLLRSGADQSILYQDSYSPLYIACQKGHLELVKQLLDNDLTGINKMTKKGSTPLYVASQRSNLNVVEYLIQKGADPSQKCFLEKGFTPMYIACQYHCFDVVKCLYKNGSDIYSINSENQSVYDLFTSQAILKIFQDNG